MTTALVAIGSSVLGGALGSLITTLLRGRYERDAQLRDRMLAAADDFATGALQAQMQLWEAAAVPSTRGGDQTADAAHVAEQLPETLRRIAVAHARLARIYVLFGKDTPAGRDAKATIDALWSGRDALQRKPDPVPADALAAMGEALGLLDSFTARAREALAQPWKLPTS